MFLDTDISLLRDYRAKTLAASPFNLDALEQILIDEVYPICRGNLFNIAGEWAGFDTQWLEDRILRRLGSPWRALHRFNLGRLTVPTSLEWRATKLRIGDLRKANGRPSSTAMA